MAEKGTYFDKLKLYLLDNKIIAFLLLLFVVLVGGATGFNQLMPIFGHLTAAPKANYLQQPEPSYSIDEQVNQRIIALDRLRPYTTLSTDEVRVVKRFVEHFIKINRIGPVEGDFGYSQSELVLGICRMIRSAYPVTGSEGADDELLEDMLDEYVAGLAVLNDQDLQFQLLKDCKVLSFALQDSTTFNAITVWEARLSNGVAIFTPDHVTPGLETRMIFVSSTDGDDGYSGFSPTQPKRTLAEAFRLTRIGSQDWVLLKRGDLFRLSGEVPFVSGKNIIDQLLIGHYGNGPNPQLVISEGVRSDWLNDRTARFIQIDIIQ